MSETTLERRPWSTPQVFRLDGKETEAGISQNHTLEGFDHTVDSKTYMYQLLSA